MTRKEAYALGNIIHKEVITFYESQFDGIFKKCNTYPQYRSFRGNISIRSKLIDQIFNDHEAQLKEVNRVKEDFRKVALDLDAEASELRTQLKAKDIAIELLVNVCKLDVETQDKYRIIIKAKDEEIKMLNEAYTSVANDFESAVIELNRLKEQKHNG